jgi:hypothetical protein
VLLTYLNKVISNITSKVINKRYIMLVVKFIGLPNSLANYKEEI